LVQLVGSNPNFVYYFGDKKTGQPIPEYLEAVRKRFGQWIRDLCERDYDRDWLRYQLEIGLRHNRAKKNRTDGVDSVEHIPMRYMIAFIVPIPSRSGRSSRRRGTRKRWWRRCIRLGSRP